MKMDFAQIFPRTATADGRLLLFTRGLRGFADGVVSVLLASYLTTIGYSPFQVGAIVTGTLVGSAAVTLAVGLFGGHLSRRRVLLASSALMIATGIGFAGVTAFWPLMIIAIVGTLNPSAGDVSLFLPTEQAVLTHTVEGRDRTLMFSWYNVVGNLTGALGALLSGVPVVLAHRHGWDLAQAQRSGFVLYAIIAVVAEVAYRSLSPAVELHGNGGRNAPLARSRRIVIHLAALFSLDSLGGGFVVQSLLVLWLFRRFGLSVETAGAIFFATGLLSAFSQLVSPWLAARIGLIETMVYTHLPANLMLVAAGLMPNATLAVAFLLGRMALSQMDVPARQSYVMAVVPPEERAAASSVTNVPRSLASSLTPLVAGAMLEHSSFGWPLICGGAVKALYDILLLIQFRAHRPPEDPR
jgi:MFS family permease